MNFLSDALSLRVPAGFPYFLLCCKFSFNVNHSPFSSCLIRRLCYPPPGVVAGSFKLVTVLFQQSTWLLPWIVLTVHLLSTCSNVELENQARSFPFEYNINTQYKHWALEIILAIFVTKIRVDFRRMVRHSLFKI